MQKDFLSADRIRTVIAVVENGSFSAAAAKLGVSQPSINQQIRRLEEELGRSLFERAGRRVALTADGEAFILFARAMRDIGESARRYFAQPRIDGIIRFGVAEEFTRTLLTRVLALFFQQFPNYELELSCDASFRLCSDLAEGRYDLVVAAKTTSQDQDLLRYVRLNWIGPRTMRLPVPDPVPLVLPSAHEPAREIVLQALRDAGRSWRLLFHSASLSALLAAVEAGIGISVAGIAVPLDGCVVLGPEAGLPPLADHAIIIKSRTGDMGVQALSAIIRSIFAQLDRADFPLDRS